MKSIIRKFVGAALLLALPLSFTSCEEILGPWQNDSNPIPPAVQVALNTALVNGAEISVSFQIDGVSYTAGFTNENGFFINGGTPPTGYSYELYEEGGFLTFELKNSASILCLKVTFNISTSTYAVYGLPGFSFDVNNFKINNTGLTITNAYPKTVTIYYYNAVGASETEKELVINYKENETWEEVATRYMLSGVEVIYTDSDTDFVHVLIPALLYFGEGIGYGTDNSYPAGSAWVPKIDTVGKKGTDNYEGKYICYLQATT